MKDEVEGRSERGRRKRRMKGERRKEEEKDDMEGRKGGGGKKGKEERYQEEEEEKDEREGRKGGRREGKGGEISE